MKRTQLRGPRPQGPGFRGLGFRGLALALALLGSPALAIDLRVLVAQSERLSVRVPVGESQALWTVTRRGTELLVNGEPRGREVFWPGGRDSVVGIGGKDYRGGVYLRAGSSGIDGINVVDVEDYLRGVVPAEMPASWHPEALRAQAIIARTYALLHINTRGAHDVCATERCQVYGGVAREHPLSDAAIASTAGQVVSFRGAVAKTFFSSDSGGYTASSAEAWNDPQPYLQAKPDPASTSPHSSWRLEVTLAQARTVAERYRVSVGALQSVRLAAFSESGRPGEVHFQGAGGQAVLRGANATGFVRALGARSSRVTLVPVQGGFVLEGSGNGHGVGLSQFGARGMAEAGFNTLQILGFYYTGAELSVVQSASARGALRPVTALQDPLGWSRTAWANAPQAAPWRGAGRGALQGDGGHPLQGDGGHPLRRLLAAGTR